VCSRITFATERATTQAKYPIPSFAMIVNRLEECKLDRKFVQDFASSSASASESTEASIIKLVLIAWFDASVVQTLENVPGL